MNPCPDTNRLQAADPDHREPDPGDRVACDLCGPAVELTRGGRLSLRHSTVDDVAGLRDLYRQLTPSDLRLRFFTAGPPSTMFLERWASLQGADGFTLVAEVTLDDGRHLVGEAGYSRLVPDRDDYELGITVAPRSRGWLGPWLLDQLLAHAAERGVANLQAVVLSENRAMMTLAAKRGYAILGHPDRGLIRLAMATAGSVPSWPDDHDRPRVLIETDRTQWFGEAALIEAGFDIALCAETCRGVKPCPVIEGEPCPLLAGADAVIVDLRDQGRADELLAHERIVHPGIQQIMADQPERPGKARRLQPDELVDRVRDVLSGKPPST